MTRCSIPVTCTRPKRRCRWARFARATRCSPWRASSSGSPCFPRDAELERSRRRRRRRTRRMAGRGVSPSRRVRRRAHADRRRDDTPPTIDRPCRNRCSRDVGRRKGDARDAGEARRVRRELRLGRRAVALDVERTTVALGGRNTCQGKPRRDRDRFASAYAFLSTPPVRLMTLRSYDDARSLAPAARRSRARERDRHHRWWLHRGGGRHVDQGARATYPSCIEARSVR